MGVDADSFQVLSSLAYAVLTFSHTCLPAAGTHEEHLVGLLEIGSVFQLVGVECAAAEHTHIGKRSGIGQRDAVCLHTAHRQTCHSAMLGVGNDAIVLLHHRDDVLQQYLLECVEEVAKATATSEASGTTSLTTGTLATLAKTALSASTLRTLTLAETSLSGCTLRTLTTLAEALSAHLCGIRIAGTARVESVIHEDDERNGLAVSNQVVHNDACFSLSAPACLVLAHTMLQVENGEFLVGVLKVLVGQVYVSVTHLPLHLRPVVHLVDRALRHILHGVELRGFGGNVDTAAPSAGTIVVSAAGIGHRGTVNVELIVVEALVLRLRGTSPYAVLVLGHLVDLAGNVKTNERSRRGRNLCPYHTL